MIVEKYQDIAGKWIVRATISDQESAFFKFNHDPTPNEVSDEVEVLKAQRIIDAIRNNPVVEDTPEVASVSPRQFRRALIQVGLLEAVEAYMATADAETRTDWEYALEIRRNYPGWDQFAAAIGKTDEDVDTVFALAAQVV